MKTVLARIWMGAAFLMLFLAGTAVAEEAGLSETNLDSKTCPDAGLLSGKMFTNICWDCLFPIRFGGIDFGSGVGDPPSDAYDNAFCNCTEEGPGGLPIKKYFPAGVSVGYWEPARVVELVRKPGCSPSLGGATLPGANARQWGSSGGSQSDENHGSSFYHFNFFAFPVLALLELWAPGGCFSDGMMDFDLMFISAVDPTWDNENLAFFAFPESAAVTNLPAQSSCVVDAAAATAGKSLDSLFWCAGAWGSMYPAAGIGENQDSVTETALLGARAVNSLHRKGLAQRTMGSDALCESQIEPFMPKSMYRFQMFHPVAQSKTFQPIGASALKWGNGKAIPVVGEDMVYILHRWNDCCSGNATVN